MARRTSRTRLSLSLALAAAALSCSAAAADVIERRGAEPELEGRLGQIDDAGVTIKSSLGADHFVPWDRVRRIETASPVPGLERRMETAVELWRARSRVERLDTAMAEPILSRIFETTRGQTHETALVVAEGLLRCRLDRDDQALAVIPALEVARLRRAGVTTGSYATLPPVIDETTALCPRLPPAWLPSPLLQTLEADLAAWDARGDAVLSAVAAMYRGAMRRSAHMAAVPDPQNLPDHPGVALLADLARCTVDDADQRESARERLRRRLDALPPWAQAWGRFGIGLSLLGEDGRGRRQQGMVSLAWLPARYARTQPFLAGLSLGYIAAGLDQTGDAAGAEAIRNQLRRSFPDHPINSFGLARLRAPELARGAPQEDHGSPPG